MAAYKQTDRQTRTHKQKNKHTYIHTNHFMNNFFILLVPDDESPLSM